MPSELVRIKCHLLTGERSSDQSVKYEQEKVRDTSLLYLEKLFHHVFNFLKQK